MFGIIDVFSDYTKMSECLESCKEIKRTYHDPDLTRTAKTAEIIAQATFVATQTVEFELRKNVSVAPVAYTANGIADVVKIGVHAYVRQEDLKETVVKVGKKVVSHTQETVASLLQSPQFKSSPAVQKVYIAVTAFNFVSMGASYAYNNIPWRKVSSHISNVTNVAVATL